jgi:hypothetical protein
MGKITAFVIVKSKAKLAFIRAQMILHKVRILDYVEVMTWRP